MHILFSKYKVKASAMGESDAEDLSALAESMMSCSAVLRLLLSVNSRMYD